MYCSKCGAQVMEGTSFCMQCGTSLQNNPPVQTKPDSEVKENMKQQCWKQFFFQCGGASEYERFCIGIRA